MCDVDIDTGQITTSAIDRAGTVYDAHPVSGKRFAGFHVPHWDRVTEIAAATMRESRGVNFVGWDIAVTADDVCIVEGNTEPGMGLVQAPYAPAKLGRKHLIERFMLDGSIAMK